MNAIETALFAGGRGMLVEIQENITMFPQKESAPRKLHEESDSLSTKSLRTYRET